MRLFIFLFFYSFVVTAQVNKSTNSGIRYFEFADPSCDGKCPILVFLHGHGERGNDLNKIYAQGIPRLLKNSGKKYIDGFILLCPQQTTNYNGWIGGNNGSTISQFINYVSDTYKYNGNLFVTGLSMGGDGSWQSSYDPKIIPGTVTGIIPVSGSGDYNGGKIAAQRGVNVWAIHGTKDNTVNISNAQRPLNGYSSDPNAFNYLFTEAKDYGHTQSFWDLVYSFSPRKELGNQTIYDWILSFNPKEVVDINIKDDIGSYIYIYTEDQIKNAYIFMVIESDTIKIK